MNNDTYSIIPKGAVVADVRSFDFQVRTLADYDANFLQDRLRADVFVNGTPVGVYSAMVIPDEFVTQGQFGIREAMQVFGPDLERIVVDEFMGLGYRKKVRQLEIELKHLRDFVERDRWFHFVPVRRAYAEARLRILGALDHLWGREH